MNAVTEHFAFGENWTRFLESLTDERIEAARKAMSDMLGDIRGVTFLDVGCGSGLSSLAAAQLGASVVAFDYDAECVSCALELQRRHRLSWPVERGDILQAQDLGKFAVVYSWGVLHHTGNMRQAFDNVAKLVKPSGRLFVAIYNDQGLMSRYWKAAKWTYNTGTVGRWLMTAAHLPYFLARLAVRTIKRRQLERGMNLWRDYIDWIGGYPFEVATPEAVIEHFQRLGFYVEKTRLVGRKSGCNEFVFRLQS